MRNDKNDHKRQGYTVHVMNTATGTERDVQVPVSERLRQLYSLWPTYTPYIIGFALMGLSFIAHTLKLTLVFDILLLAAGVTVFGTALYRYVTRRP
jgi:hypothetical protein